MSVLEPKRAVYNPLQVGEQWEFQGIIFHYSCEKSGEKAYLYLPSTNIIPPSDALLESIPSFIEKISSAEFDKQNIQYYPQKFHAERKSTFTLELGTQRITPVD